MTEQTARQKAALFAAHRFEALTAAQDDIQGVGKMSSLDVATCALHAKEEAEGDYGARITATLDEEGNWSFA